MPFKLNFEPTPEFKLTGHAVVQVSGIDSGVFLQAQCMNDVNNLGEACWQYNGWLNPQGRVMALFYLLKLDASHFYLVIPSLDPHTLLAELQRFVFRAKVRLSVASEMAVIGQFVAESFESAKTCRLGEADTPLAWRSWGCKGQRRLCLRPASTPENAELQVRWQACDLALGWPWIGELQRGLWTPHMLSLERLEAFSLKKGCYPGQEIVARTHYLGKSKRCLMAVSGLGLVALQSIQQQGSELGKVVNASPDGNMAIAVLPRDFDDSITLSNALGPVSVSALEMC
jgi:tRNA-modifying protein YgfZ